MKFHRATKIHLRIQPTMERREQPIAAAAVAVQREKVSHQVKSSMKMASLLSLRFAKLEKNLIAQYVIDLSEEHEIDVIVIVGVAIRANIVSLIAAVELSSLTENFSPVAKMLTARW